MINKITIMLCLFSLSGAANLSAQVENPVTGNNKEEMLRKNADILKAEIATIKNDASLTEAEKKTLIKEKKAASVTNRKGNLGKRNGARKRGSAELRNEIEAIKNDASLTQEEKEILIKEKKDLHRETLQNGGRKDKAKGSAEHKREIEAIKNDATLNDEQKEALIKEKRKTLKGKQSLKGGKKKGNWRTDRSQLKQELETIQNDPNLTAEQKEAKRKAIINSKASEVREGKMKRDDKAKAYKEEKESFHKNGKKSKFAPRKLTEEQRADALARLDKNTAVLDKKLKKGKITQVNYDSAIARMQEVRKQVLEN